MNRFCSITSYHYSNNHRITYSNNYFDFDYLMIIALYWKQYNPLAFNDLLSERLKLMALKVFLGFLMR